MGSDTSIVYGWWVDSGVIGFADRMESRCALVGYCENEAPCVKPDYLRRRQSRGAACPEVIVPGSTCCGRASVAEERCPGLHRCVAAGERSSERDCVNAVGK